MKERMVLAGSQCCSGIIYARDDGHRRVADVRRDERAEALLPSRVPDLQPDGAVFQIPACVARVSVRTVRGFVLDWVRMCLCARCVCARALCVCARAVCARIHAG